MKKIFTYFLGIITIFMAFGVENIFANTAHKCPDFSKIELSADEVVAKVNQCLVARSVGNSASITDFQCPSGEFSFEDGQGLTRDRIAYHIAVNLHMNAVDEKMKVYMQWLQSERNKDVVAWTEAYGSCIEGRPQGSVGSLTHFYDHICGFSTINNFLNSNTLDEKFAVSSEAFPQSMCVELARKKKEMWATMGSFMMQQWMSKSYENDRKYFVEAVQGQYRGIIERFHNYQKIVFRASSKLTHYIREAVK